jgi:hypothetical protein
MNEVHLPSPVIRVVEDFSDFTPTLVLIEGEEIVAFGE